MTSSPHSSFNSLPAPVVTLPVSRFMLIITVLLKSFRILFVCVSVASAAVSAVKPTLSCLHSLSLTPRFLCPIRPA